MTPTTVRPPDLGSLPADLMDDPHWVGCRLPGKVPINPGTGLPADVTDSTTWGTPEAAFNLLEAGGCQAIGYVFMERVGIVGVDLDDCRNPDTGALTELARTVVGWLDSYTEISLSGTGLHVLVRGTVPKSYKGAGIELYATRRYFIVTGNLLPGPPATIEPRQSALDAIVAQYFPPGTPSVPRPELGTIPEGERHNTIIRVLGAARRHGATEADLRALGESLAARCSPPYPAHDLERDVQSVAQYAPAEAPIRVEDFILPGDKAKPAPLVWRTAQALCAAASPTPEIIVPPFLYAGASTKFDGTPKKGKTTLRNYLIRCALTGAAPFGYPAGPRTPVVLATEEPEGVLIDNVRAAGLADATDLHVVTLFDLRALKWDAVVTALHAKALEVGARLVWIDTLSALAGISGEEENQSGVALTVMRPVALLTSAGLAVGLCHHDRKSGGEVGESGRGSSAWAGAVDIIVALRSAKGLRETCRELHAIGRFRRIPHLITVELCEDTGRQDFVRVDPLEAAGTEDTTAQVWRALPREEATAATADDLATRTGLSVNTVRRSLDVLAARQQVTRTGTGRKGHAHRFAFIPFDSLPQIHVDGMNELAGQSQRLFPPSPNKGLGTNGTNAEGQS